MSGFLLDTCAISELRKKRPNLGLLGWIADLAESTLFISTITLGELRQGVQLVADRRKRADIDRWLVSEVSARFAGRILAFDVDAADRWGRIAADARRSGKPIGTSDAMIASVALSHSLSLVTRNESDFVASGVSLVNPWIDEL